MVLAIEPGTYFPGGGGLRLEDNFLITADGARAVVPLSGQLPPMIDRTLIFTGDINERSVDTSAFEGRRIGLYDSTLRDGEQTVGVVLTPDDKLVIARALDELGVDRIEAGFPRVSAGDVEAYELIMAAGLRAEIWGFSRAVPADVEQLLDLGVRAAVVEAPLSDGKLAAYGMDRDKVMGRVVGAVEYAVANGVTVCFFGVDGTRADPAFLADVYQAAVGAGAQEVALVDTLGIAAPEAAASMIIDCRAWVGPDVPLHWHGHNDFGLAVSGSIAAVAAGADWVQGAINGMGERAGNMNLAEFALAIEALYHAETGMRFDRLAEVSALVQARSGYALEPYKPLTRREPIRQGERCGRSAVPRRTSRRAVFVRGHRSQTRDRPRQEEWPGQHHDQTV